MSETKLSFRDLRHPDLLLATALGVGFLRPAPGTWGSAFAVLLWWLLPALQVWEGLLIAALATLLGWWLCERVSRRLNIGDAGELVIDEVAGMWFALALSPRGLWWMAAAFLLFRLLDIAKPGPIGWCDRHIKGGLGVMADDVVAGIAVGGVLWVTAQLVY